MQAYAAPDQLYGVFPLSDDLTRTQAYASICSPRSNTSIHDEPVNECIRCGAKDNVQRLISGTVGISFKGPGFYITDSQKPTSTAASDSN
jgi:predicted nucleic acid-binding Zn ribbon protein